MRDFSADHRWLSLNTATVRRQGDLAQIIDACARHGIRAIDPWRDQVAAIGLDRAVRAVRDAGLELSGYCRGGMFTSDAAHRIEVRDDNRRAVDEAKALGAPCIVLVAGGLPQYSRPGSAPSRDIAAARAQVEDVLAELMDYTRAAQMPLAIEPLHLRQAGSWAHRRAGRRARRLSHLVGSRAAAADCPRWKRSPAGVSRLRLAGADQRHSQRPRHDGRWGDRYQIGARRGRGAGLCRLLRNRDFLQRLVGKADR